MRANSNPVDFFLKMKKKPKQKELYENLDNLTEEDIDKCGQPLWIRQVLKRLKNGYMNVEQIADAMTVVPAEEKEYDVFRFASKTEEIKLNSGTVEVNRDDLIMVFDTKVIISNFLYDVLDVPTLLKKSTYIGKMYKQDFFQMYTEEVQRKLV